MGIRELLILWLLLLQQLINSWMEVSAPDGDLGPRMDIWAPDTGLDSGFMIRVRGWNSGPWHEGLGPECRSEPLREGWILGWRSENPIQGSGFWILGS